MTKKRIVSIDYGLKRIGLAISDESKIIATSLGIVQAGKDHAQTIVNILHALKSFAIEHIIIGNPIHMNGKVSPLSEEVGRFLILLQEHVTCGVSLFDERLSSLQAERILKESGMQRKKRTQFIDGLSAVIVLQSYLQSRSPI